jgi:hypothetical protein
LPNGDSNDDAVLRRFVTAGVKIAPDATGTAIYLQAYARAVVDAFIEAGVLSFVAICGLLLLALRRVRDVAITMAPIVLTGLLTMGTCVVIGQPLNFANIIALPLLFGIGVAFHIYFVMAWRSGGSHLLTSSLARGVFFSALATATGFGSLWASSHPGQAADDISGLDPRVGAALSTGADGCREAEKPERRRYYFISASLALLRWANRVGAPPAAIAAAKSERRRASSLTPLE